ncbi:PREDICTED: uncharacterized protein LOC106297449 [Brassica oleracea var. oleracea]|uniref:uncharacterized protein LOC106297449 n=1 Tax=Brassica oleracea var. oleracea TaxID=109376 RepID=UPI0006A6C544|nr:PREDICTED: uncharacterized protein LOC106297449 [Brassica oleracea var. oleracea]
MGGLPPRGDSVRAIKDYRRQAVTVQKWPTQVKADNHISFSAADTRGISMLHNDPLLIDIGIGECQVTKVVVDTGSSVDFIFRDTLDRMGIDLRDMKPSSRTLTGFNGSSEQMIETIRLPVYAGDVTWTVKFSVIRAKCVKFPGKERTTQTIRGDRRAAREQLIAAIKLQQLVSLINSVAKPIHKVYPQKEEVREVRIDEADPKKVIRIGAFLSDEMQSQVISFLRANASTFAWTTSDMKGIDPTVASHELNVDPTFKPIRQKRRKLGPERSEAVNEEVDRLLEACFISEVRYPLPHIDRLVESTAGNELLTFMDAFPGYNQILMHPDDREKTTFITDRGTYCYKVMPFGLKNAGATYQRLVNRMFVGKLGDTMEVYIDDMLVKSLHAENHLDHLRDFFRMLNEFGMKLNLAKCTFGVTSGEFMGYIVTQRGIEANPKQITAILDLPRSREVQRLTGRITALNRFISRSTYKCLPFYELLRGNKRFIWEEKCEEAFNQLKHYLTTPPVLSKPESGDTMSLYIAVTSSAVSSVLIREDRGEQKPIFYISKRMTEPEMRYPTLEKMALDGSHRRYLVEKTQALLSITYDRNTLQPAPQNVSNNKAEYESLIVGLRLTKAIKANRISAYCDSQLVVSQYLGDYDVRNDRMDAYLKLVKNLTRDFEFFKSTKVPRGENICADALAALGSKLHDQVKRTIPIHMIEKPSISQKTEQLTIAAAVTDAMHTDEAEPCATESQLSDWREEFIAYLSDGKLPTANWEARRLKRHSAHYVVKDGDLHRWTATKVLLKCISGDETRLVMAETHEGAAGNHSGG